MLARVIAQRLLGILPQLLLAALGAFLLVQLIPGDPVIQMTGGYAEADEVARRRAQLGLDQPLLTQAWDHLSGVARGDLGRAWFTGRPVSSDLLDRVGTTLELIACSLVLAVGVALPASLLVAARPASLLGRAVRRVLRAYSFLSGAMPDFMVGLLLIFGFYVTVQLVPAPIGRIPPLTTPAPTVTGIPTIDALLTGDLGLVGTYASHLVLPVLALAIVHTGNLVKVGAAAAEEVLRSPYLLMARAAGVSRPWLVWYAARNVLPPIITLTGMLFSTMFGGAVVVEALFGLGGVGQYAVRAVANSDLPALQGFVVFAAAVNLLVYLAVDVLYVVANPAARARTT